MEQRFIMRLASLRVRFPWTGSPLTCLYPTLAVNSKNSRTPFPSRAAQKKATSQIMGGESKEGSPTENEHEVSK